MLVVMVALMLVAEVLVGLALAVLVGEVNRVSGCQSWRRFLQRKEVGVIGVLGHWQLAQGIFSVELLVASWTAICHLTRHRLLWFGGCVMETPWM